MKIIFLTQGQYATLDDIDLFSVMKYWPWSAYKERNTFYAAARNGKSHISMHEIVAKRMRLIIPKNGFIDHKNRNGLHNYRDNIRAATGTQSNANRGKYAKSTSKYKGVQKISKYCFRARICINHKAEDLGYYTTEEMAARVYDFHAIKYFGEFASLNFPNERM